MERTGARHRSQGAKQPWFQRPAEHPGAALCDQRARVDSGHRSAKSFARAGATYGVNVSRQPPYRSGIPCIHPYGSAPDQTDALVREIRSVDTPRRADRAPRTWPSTRRPRSAAVKPICGRTRCSRPDRARPKEKIRPPGSRSAQLARLTPEVIRDARDLSHGRYFRVTLLPEGTRRDRMGHSWGSWSGRKDAMTRGAACRHRTGRGHSLTAGVLVFVASRTSLPAARWEWTRAESRCSGAPRHGESERHRVDRYDHLGAARLQAVHRRRAGELARYGVLSLDAICPLIRKRRAGGRITVRHLLTTPAVAHRYLLPRLDGPPAPWIIRMPRWSMSSRGFAI